jgi:D-tyrosyl-tRNA(Tyr) deacylase
MVRGNFVATKTGGGHYIRMFGNGKCVRRNSFGALIPKEEPIEEVKNEEVEALKKIIKAKPQLEKVSENLGKIKIARHKKPIAFDPKKKDEEW